MQDFDDDIQTFVVNINRQLDAATTNLLEQSVGSRVIGSRDIAIPLESTDEQIIRHLSTVDTRQLKHFILALNVQDSFISVFSLLYFYNVLGYFPPIVSDFGVVYPQALYMESVRKYLSFLRPVRPRCSADVDRESELVLIHFGDDIERTKKFLEAHVCSVTRVIDIEPRVDSGLFVADRCSMFIDSIQVIPPLHPNTFVAVRLPDRYSSLFFVISRGLLGFFPIFVLSRPLGSLRLLKVGSFISKIRFSRWQL